MTTEAALSMSNGATQGPMEAGYGFSMSDASGFDAALAGGAHQLGVQAVTPPATDLSVFVKPLSSLDKDQAELLQSISADKKDMNFSEMYGLMARFGMYSAQVTLVSSIASKASEGLQQLFRQQS